MAVALDGSVRVDVNASGTGDTTQIIAGQVDKHHVFGVFLRICEERCLMSTIGSRVIRSGSRSGDGPQLRAPSFELYQRLRGRTDHRHVTQRAVVHIG